MCVAGGRRRRRLRRRSSGGQIRRCQIRTENPFLFDGIKGRNSNSDEQAIPTAESSNPPNHKNHPITTERERERMKSHLHLMQQHDEGETSERIISGENLPRTRRRYTWGRWRTRRGGRGGRRR